MKTKLIKTEDYLLLIDEEAEIRKSDWIFLPLLKQAVLKSVFDNPNSTAVKIIAYYPLTKEAKELDLPLLPNPFEDNIEELACNIYGLSLSEYEYIKEELSQNRELIEEHYRDIGREEIPKRYFDVLSFVCGYQAAQSKQFSLEDMIGFAKFYIIKHVIPYELDVISGKITDEQKIQMLKSDVDYDWNELVQEYIQSLSTQKLPVSFEPEYETPYSDGFAGDRVRRFYGKPVLKTITNSEGKQELVGSYKY